MDARRTQAGFSALPRVFFDLSADQVAPRLLGHFLIRNTPQGPSGGVIVEVEAYLADDPACHAFKGPTARNESMFGRPGIAYVYFIYGMHHCFNAVCRPPGHGEAVLIRALQPRWRLDWMLENRRVARARELTNGPAKLCQALAIDRGLDGVDLCDRKAHVFMGANADRQRFLATHGPVITSTRIGISRGTELPLRYYLKSNGSIASRS